MIYVTSDLHGYPPEKLQKLLDQAGFGPEDFLYILGDVIDRGPWGAELLLWATSQDNVQLLLGNHEEFLLNCSFLFEKAMEESLDALTPRQMHYLENWFYNGGRATLQGLLDLLEKDPESLKRILNYLRTAPLYASLRVKERDFVLVHAGLGNFDPRKPLEDYLPQELLWERPDLTVRYYPDITVIFGHTPTVFFGREYEGKALTTDTWTCIDTGCAAGNSPVLLRLDDMAEFYLEE